MIKLKYKPLLKIEITSEYGIRVLGGLEFHPGIDYRAALNDNIYVVDDGKVVVAKNDVDGYGLYVVIEHSNYCSLYAHMKALEVNVGQSIKAGQVIGHVGMTGMTTGPHLHFEIRDCLYDSTFWLKSILKGRHVMCINPKDLVNAAETMPQIKVEYSKTANRTYQLAGDVKDLSVKIINQKNQTIEEPYCVNGTFFWWEDTARTKTYPTSILIIDGKIYRNEANHYYDFKAPQSVFIVYNDGRVEMKKANFATDLDYKNIKVAVGGVGLRNTLDSSFIYNPASEGFKKDNRLQDGLLVDYTDVLAKRNKTVIGYNKAENKIYLMVRPNIYHKHSFLYDLQKLVKDCNYDIALSVDGGGSTFINNANEMLVFGDNRRINNIIGFGL
jgi:murein DD-endopeptidase MepM/ murein hydrolase activator NlpD